MVDGRESRDPAAVDGPLQEADQRPDGRERDHPLGVLERLRAARPTRPAGEVDQELAAIRSARRAGGRRHRTT